MQENSGSGNFGALEKNSGNLHKDRIEGNMQIRSEADSSNLHKVNDSGDEMQSGLKVEVFEKNSVQNSSVSKIDTVTEIRVENNAIKDDGKEFDGDLEKDKGVVTFQSKKDLGTDVENTCKTVLKGKSNGTDNGTDDYDCDKGSVKTKLSGSDVGQEAAEFVTPTRRDDSYKSGNVANLDIVGKIERKTVCSKKLKLESLLCGLNNQKVGQSSNLCTIHKS